MGLIYWDPITKSEVEFRRDKSNPFFEIIEGLRYSPASPLIILSEVIGDIAKEAYVLPSTFPLRMAPSLHLQIIALEKPIGTRRFQVYARMGYFNMRYWDHFAARKLLRHSWIAAVWDQYFRPLLSDDLEYSCLNYRSMNEELEIFICDGGREAGVSFIAQPWTEKDEELGWSDPNKNEKPHLQFLKLCLAWDHWEAQRISWLARTEEAISLGICRGISEDSFRDRCQKSGLFVPKTIRR